MTEAWFKTICKLWYPSHSWNKLTKWNYFYILWTISKILINRHHCQPANQTNLQRHIQTETMTKAWFKKFWNSAGHLLQKTTPKLTYFNLRYVFWEHHDSVGWGSTIVLSMRILWTISKILILGAQPPLPTNKPNRSSTPHSNRNNDRGVIQDNLENVRFLDCPDFENCPDLRTWLDVW